MGLGRIAALAAALAPAAAAAQDFQIEIGFHFRPDNSGANTQTRFLTLDEGWLEIEENGPSATRGEERDATPEEIAALLDLVQKRFSGLALRGGEPPFHPRVEVWFEFDGGDVEAQLGEFYPAGGVPEDLLALQERYFETVLE